MRVAGRTLGALLGLAVVAAAVEFAPWAGAAGPVPIPLSSPAPGSPVFVSFKSTYDGNFTTSFQITATGSDLAYVWSLQNVQCGSLVSPQSRGSTNGYAHESCPTAQELPVRVTVFVARASDLNANGTPKNDDVPRFVYSQIARAQDSADTANVQPAPSLQYFGPAPGAAATASAGATNQSGPVTQEGANGTDWLGPGGAILLFLIAVGLGEWVLSRDDCDWLKQLCEEAKEVAARRAHAARDAHARANAARSKCNDANREADRLRRAAEDADRPPSEGSSWVEDPETGRRITSRDLALERDADKAAYGAYKRGEKSGDQLQEDWGKSGTAEQQAENRRRDDAARGERAKAAHDAADAAEAKADTACKDADQASLDAQQADAIADAAAKQAEEICEMAARLCPDEAPAPLPPAPPTPPTPPTPPPTTPPPTTPPEPEGPPPTSHQYKLEHHRCCESGEYYGYAKSMEQSSLPIVTKLLSFFKGEWSETGWFTTGYDYWEGGIYCSSDSNKFAKFEAKAPRTGLALGGGGGITYIHCSGRNHPQEVIDEIPNMMSGYSGDIAGTASFLAAMKGPAKLMGKVAPWINNLHPLDAAAKGLGIAAFQSLVSSQVQGAERCVTATFDLTMQVGAWHVDSKDVVVICRDYGCCFNCAKYVDYGDY